MKEGNLKFKIGKIKNLLPLAMIVETRHASSLLMKIKNSVVLIIAAIMLSFPAPLLAGEMGKQEIEEMFAQANTLFRQAHETDDKELYIKAAMRYERIVRDGEIKNGKLYYNIGNTYFQMGKTGHAILNYRRAERFMPNDENLRQNLDYAISRRRDTIEATPQTQALKTILFWHYDIPHPIKTRIFAVLFALFWIGMSVRLLSSRFMPRWLLVSLAMLAALFLGSLGANTLMPDSGNRGVILTQEVVARKGNSKNYERSFTEPLHRGTEFILVEERDEWFRIELPDNRTCWIPAKEVELI